MTTFESSSNKRSSKPTGEDTVDLDGYLTALTEDPVDLDPIYAESVGRTTFDLPGAEDGTVTAILHREEMESVPAQSLVRLTSKDDSRVRRYIGAVVAGPFAEPDGMRADSPMVVTTAARGAMFMPQFHGRIQIELIGEEDGDGRLVPPRFRPRPNSAVHVLSTVEKEQVLNAKGDISLGVAVGDPDISVGIPAEKKSVLPRHTAIIGTTGAGKSTTVGNLVHEAADAGWSVVLLDTEGEYVGLDRATDDPGLLAALQRRGIEPAGLEHSQIYHLVGTSTANSTHQSVATFSPSFSALSPHAVAEILGMNDAQQERFFRATDIAKEVLRQAKIFPRPGREAQEDERRIAELNEFEEGYPQLGIDLLIDTMKLLMDMVSGEVKSQDDLTDWRPHGRSVLSEKMELRRKVFMLAESSDGKKNAIPGSTPSWRKTYGLLYRLRRLNIFDQHDAPAIDIDEMLTPGKVSIVDFSDLDAPEINNIVISDLLRRIQISQDTSYGQYEAGERASPRKVLVIIEEAHEFLSADRVSRMPILLQQVNRIAKRGRKRWLGLVFVTQLPQHLPREVLALTNNVVLHKTADEMVLRNLRNSVPGIDAGTWRKIPALAPGQAVVSFAHMKRPVLTAMDPSPGRLRMTE